MDDTKKGFRPIHGLLILVVVGVLGFIGWGIWHSKNNSNKTNFIGCSTTVPATSGSAQLPSDWTWHEYKDIGLKFAYPSSWGTATDQTNSGGIIKYVSSFTEESSGANTMVTLNLECSELQTALSDINNGKFDTLSGPTIIKAIKHDQTSYSSMSHWTGDAGNIYELITNDFVNVGNIRSVIVDYTIGTGSEVCPDDSLAPSGGSKCINQSISDVADEVIGSLQKI